MNKLARNKNHTEKYSIDKLSSPGFTLYTNHTSVILNIVVKQVKTIKIYSIL